MFIEKQYDPQEVESELAQRWQSEGIYKFDSNRAEVVYAIDTPPPTVSGKLHIGHLYSYSHPDFIARYQRMRGKNIYYPMGFDDNGLPTERLVERTIGIRSQDVGPDAFIEKCLEVSIEAEKDYTNLFRRLGLSVDWGISYRTIDRYSQLCSQRSFLDLYRKGLVYRAQAPGIWCPECRASFAQADLDDHLRLSEYVILPFLLGDGRILPVATTRPELLSACVAVFVNPDDRRYQEMQHYEVTVPLYGQRVKVMTDPDADPSKGTGAVMCCTYGDQADVVWQRVHHLPVINAIDAIGKMTSRTMIPDAEKADQITGMSVNEARRKIKEILTERGLILSRQPCEQSIRVHERCGSPIEYRVVNQWFIRILENKDNFLRLGEQLRWHPAHMGARYRAWVENLNWDWSISRQRIFGIPFPVWFCRVCGATILANEEELPVDPWKEFPSHPCICGSKEFIADEDVMDTWATSSLTPQIATGWLDKQDRFSTLFPLTLRPQAHDIIRTWLFYSIVKSWYQFGRLPWTDALISGWGVAGEGQEKISKSKGGGPIAPMILMEKYSADAVRYWASSAGLGKDAVINDEKFRMGSKLITKLWNVARFSAPFLSDAPFECTPCETTSADAWILSRVAWLIDQVTSSFENYDYASARSEIEEFFWHDLADNYLEMAKLRLYDEQHPAHRGACLALRITLHTVLKLLAPIMPYITEKLWMMLFKDEEGGSSIHCTRWPVSSSSPILESFTGGGEGKKYQPQELFDLGNSLIAVATAIRRYKSEHGFSLGRTISCLEIATANSRLQALLKDAYPDLTSITRAQQIQVVENTAFKGTEIGIDHNGLRVAVTPD